MYYLDKKIENLHRIFDQNERSSFLRLDLNENPGGLPEDFIKDVMAKVTHAWFLNIRKPCRSQKSWLNFLAPTFLIYAL